MTTVIIAILIFIIICMFLIWLISGYNRFQTFIIRINEAENFIDTTLRKRFDLLNKSVAIIQEKADDKKVMTRIISLKDKKVNNFELDRELYECINDFNRYKEKFPELTDNETFLKIDLNLSESEAEIVAARKYYNDIITDYNKLVKRFPSNMIALVFRYKVKMYYDGKEDFDDKVFKM